MGVQLLDIEVQVRKVLIFSIKTCYETASNHPFLVGFLCFLAFLHRSFPLVFSVLVSVSPVLICTAILLGILLSFGHPNTPQVEREGDEKTVHGIIPLRTGVLPSTTVVEREEERYSCVNRHTNASNGNDLEQSSGNVGKESRGVELFDGGILEHGYSPIPNMDDENLDFDDERLGGSFGSYMDYQNLDFDKKSVDSFDSKMVNIGSPLVNREILEPHQYSRVPDVDDDENLEFDSDSKLARVDWNQDEEEEEDVGDTASDSGSDGAESSSPDASMADIIPMLSELHPLLDEEESNNPHHANDSESESESDDGTENREGEAEAKEKNSDKEEETEGAAIVWTEEDEKNLMDLGSSEIERNQRLESLIARRRARKGRRTTIERNLIDFDSVDLTFNISPISTTRKNPFDVPVDDHYGIGLPPIPGSAPSVLLPRSNPFDIPYDSSEEKLDLMEDSFQQEFKTFHAKDPFFRRHESFNVRPSSFGPSKQGTGLEGASYSRFQRQSSELSDSKISQVPETDSTDSANDLEAKNLGDEIEMSWKSEEHCYELGPSLVHEGRVAKDLDLSATKINSKPESFETSLGWADVDENQYREPVYDISPTRAKEICLSSIASDVQVERIHEMEKSTPISEETLSVLPQSQPVVVEKELISNLDIKGHTELQEPPVILMESSKEAGESNVLGIKEVDSEARLNTVTPQPPVFAAILRTPDDGQTDIRESSFNEPQDDDLINAPIPHMFLMEATDFHEKMQHIIEETDGIKEIDEGILNELDAVGDFSVKEPVLGSFNEFENLSIIHNIGSFTTRFLEGEEDQDSIYDHEKTFAFLGTSQLNQNSSIEDIKLGMPLVGARSLKDLDSLYEQAKLDSMENKEVLERSELPQDVPLEGDTNSGHNIQEDEKYLLDHPSHTDSGMPIHEAQSIQANDSQFKHIDNKEDENHNLLDPSSQANDEKAAGKSENAIDIGIPVHEAQSIQDIDSSFKQPDKKEDEKCDLGDPSTHANNEKASVESESSENAIPQHEQSMLLDNQTHFEESTVKEDVEDKSENPLKPVSQDESDIDVESKDSNLVTFVEKGDHESVKETSDSPIPDSKSGGSDNQPDVFL